MKEEKEYIRDLAEIRSMMERSSKFLSLSGWAGILVGLYALAAAYVAYAVLGFNPQKLIVPSGTGQKLNLPGLILLALGLLFLAMVTAILFSVNRARRRQEVIWNTTSRRMIASMAIPLFTGGLLVLILLEKDVIGLLAPATLIFYGLSLYNASRFTYAELKIFGIILVALGLLGAYFISYGLPLWAIGFGLVHIIYGIYMYFKYEK